MLLFDVIQILIYLHSVLVIGSKFTQSRGNPFGSFILKSTFAVLFPTANNVVVVIVVKLFIHSDTVNSEKDVEKWSST